MVKSCQKLSNWPKPTWKTCWFTLRTSQIIRAKTWKNNMQRFPTNPDKSLTQNLCKKNKTIFSRWTLLIFEPAKSCYMFHSLGQEEWHYILDLWCFVVFHSSVWNIIHYFTCLMESCKYMYESPLTMMNSLHKHAVIQIEKIQHSSAHHSLISANVMSHDDSYDSNVPWKVGISHVWAIDIIRSYEN